MILFKRLGIGLLWQNLFARNFTPRSLFYSARTSLFASQDNTMENFLRNSGSLLQPGFKTFRIYTGNEASDADSIISALVSAYGGFCEDIINNNQPTIRHQPIVSINRPDLRLKQDVELLLKKASLLSSDLVCANEIPWTELRHFYENIEVVLLDHNSLHDKLEHSLLESQLPFEVIEIMDHHLDVGKHMDTVKRRLVAFDSITGKATAGSTCSLLVQRYKNIINWALNGHSPALLLLGVILLDTFAENPKFAKNTPLDDGAKDFLSTILQLPTEEHPQLFAELANAKFNPLFWQLLTASDCLRYDYKRFIATQSDNDRMRVAIGTSSVLLPLSSLITSKTDFLPAVLTYLEHPNINKERVDLVAILSFILDPHTQKPQRELLLISLQPTLLDHFRIFAHENAQGNFFPEMHLELQEVSLNVDDIPSKKEWSSLQMVLFRQGNVAASRKQVAPVLLQIANHYLTSLNK